MFEGFKMFKKLPVPEPVEGKCLKCLTLKLFKPNIKIELMNHQQFNNFCGFLLGGAAEDQVDACGNTVPI